jgi:hypothetical protein
MIAKKTNRKIINAAAMGKKDLGRLITFSSFRKPTRK